MQKTMRADKISRRRPFLTMAAIRMRKAMMGARINKYIIMKIGSTMMMSNATTISAPIAAKAGSRQLKRSR
jgi:hypothetical protein